VLLRCHLLSHKDLSDQRLCAGLPIASLRHVCSPMDVAGTVPSVKLSNSDMQRLDVLQAAASYLHSMRPSGTADEQVLVV
jgi:hypothetical protein